MRKEMSHVRQVLDGLLVYLFETYHQTLDWLAELQSEAG